MLKRFARRRSALAVEPFEALRATLLASNYIGETTLNGPFEASRGFGVTFTSEGREKLTSRFPTLAPWLDITLGVPAIAALTPWWRKTQTERLPNAWYLNVLVVGPGAEVPRHIDGTLMGMAEVTDHPPECVSVLYLDVPNVRGGELELWAGRLPAGRITPKTRDAVHFRGDLAHAVRPFTGSADARRSSLVIEQYHFAPDALARLPSFRLESRAGFGAFLDDHAQRPATQFERER